MEDIDRYRVPVVVEVRVLVQDRRPSGIAQDPRNIQSRTTKKNTKNLQGGDRDREKAAESDRRAAKGRGNDLTHESSADQNVMILEQVEVKKSIVIIGGNPGIALTVVKEESHHESVGSLLVLTSSHSRIQSTIRRIPQGQ